MDLPSVAATFPTRRGEPSLRRLPEFERFAMGEYRADLAARAHDVTATERLIGGLATITGLQIDTVRALGSRSGTSRVASPRDLLTPRRYMQQVSSPTECASLADASMVWKMDFPHGVVPEYDLTGPMEQAMVALAKEKFGWKPARDYEMRGVGWSREKLESLTPIRALLARDPGFRVLVAHGSADVLTPYYTSKLHLKPLLEEGPRPRIALKVYEGLHMFYFRDDSRAMFRTDAADYFAAIAR